MRERGGLVAGARAGGRSVRAVCLGVLAGSSARELARGPARRPAREPFFDLFRTDGVDSGVRGVRFDLICVQSILPYLLRPVLKATPGLGRNSSCRSVLMVSTSSRAKSNNIVAGDKLNSDYFSFYSLA